MDAPVACLVGIGQGRAADGLARPHVAKLGCLRRQASFDVVQALPVGGLGEGYDAKLLGTSVRSNPMVAAVTSHDPMESLPRQETHNLGDSRLACVHQHPRVRESRKAAKWGRVLQVGDTMTVA